MSLPASSQDLSGAQCRLLTLLFDRLTPDVSVVPGGAQGESKVVENLEQTAVALKDFSESDVTVAFEIAALQAPFHIPLFGTLIGILNVQGSPLPQALLTRLWTRLGAALGSERNLKAAKCILRLMAELVGARVVAPEALLQVLKALADKLENLEISLPQRDQYAFLILATLPWAAQYLAPDHADALNELTVCVQAFMASRPALKIASGVSLASEAVATYRAPAQESLSFASSLDILEQLWTQIEALERDGWDCQILSSPVKLFQASFESATPLDVQTFEVPAQIISGPPVKFNYQPVFWVFDDSVSREIAQVAPTTHISRFILNDFIHDVIQIFALNHTEASKILLQLPNYCPEYAAQLNVYQSLVEGILMEMLRLPRPQEKIVYYSTLLMDLCKGALDKVPSAMGRALKVVFERMDAPAGGMDVECIRRLSEWFSHHLSNFGYGWKWKDWVPAVIDSKTSAKYAFVRETVGQCVRLSYYDRIKSILPTEYVVSGVLPNVEPGFDFKYVTSTSTGVDKFLFDQAARLCSLIASRKEKETVEAILHEIRGKLNGESEVMDAMSIDSGSTEDIVRDVFLQCLMLHGSKSFSHLLSVVERYLPVLQSLNALPEAKAHTIKVVATFWKRNTQFLEIILDKFMNYRVLDPASIISWILSADNLQQNYSRFFIWSILRTTLNKILLKVDQLQLKLKESKESNAMKEETDGATDVYEAAYESAVRERKEAFILVFQRFVEVMTEKLKLSGAEDDQWWRWVSGFMRETGRNFQNEIMGLTVTLDMIIFTEDIDPKIRRVWEELKALDSQHSENAI